jgi:hypothetical protein
VSSIRNLNRQAAVAQARAAVWLVLEGRAHRTEVVKPVPVARADLEALEARPEPQALPVLRARLARRERPVLRALPVLRARLARRERPVLRARRERPVLRARRERPVLRARRERPVLRARRERPVPAGESATCVHVVPGLAPCGQLSCPIRLIDRNSLALRMGNCANLERGKTHA